MSAVMGEVLCVVAAAVVSRTGSVCCKRLVLEARLLSSRLSIPFSNPAAHANRGRAFRWPWADAEHPRHSEVRFWIDLASRGGDREYVPCVLGGPGLEARSLGPGESALGCLAYREDATKPCTRRPPGPLRPDRGTRPQPICPQPRAHRQVPSPYVAREHSRHVRITKIKRAFGFRGNRSS